MRSSVSLSRLVTTGAALVVALSAVLPISALAVDCSKEYCALSTIPGATEACTVSQDGKTVSCTETTNPIKAITNIYGIAIAIAAVLAVGIIIWAGVEYATTEAITGKSGAKEKWEGALWGLGLLLASYLILRTINADLVNINLNLGEPRRGTLSSSLEEEIAALQKLLNERKTSAETSLKQQDQTNQAKIDALQTAVSAETDQKAKADKSELLARAQAKLEIDRQIGEAYETLLRNGTNSSYTERNVLEANKAIEKEVARLTALQRVAEQQNPPDVARVTDISSELSRLTKVASDFNATLNKDSAIQEKKEKAVKVISDNLYIGDTYSDKNYLSDQEKKVNLMKGEIASQANAYIAGLKSSNLTKEANIIQQNTTARLKEIDLKFAQWKACYQKSVNQSKTYLDQSCRP